MAELIIQTLVLPIIARAQGVCVRCPGAPLHWHAVGRRERRIRRAITRPKREYLLLRFRNLRADGVSI